MRRICLFSGFDKNSKIQDYVVYLIQKLAEISDVYYISGIKIAPDEMIKIAPYTKMFYHCNQDLRDFGNWQYLVAKIGWNKLAEYDEVIFCNDSVYGPLYNLEEMFWQMERRSYDFWSVTADYQQHFHLHSYFMVFNQDVVKHEKFQQFWQSVPLYQNAENCEMELTPLLTSLGFVGNSYVKNYSRHNVLYDPERMIEKYAAPFIKVKSFLPENNYSVGTGLSLRYKLRTQTDYDVGLIKRHIRDAHLPQSRWQKIVALSGL